MQDIATILISIAGSMAVGIVGTLMVRKKNRAETQGIVVEQFDKLVKTQNIQIEKNEKKIKELEVSNEDCEYRHEVTQLQVNQLMKLIDFNSMPKATVFVLDDNQMVIEEFKWRFKNVTVLDLRCFVDSMLFLREAQTERPEVVILDYVLDQGLTAEDVIDQLGYEPEVFIMSQDKSLQLKFKQKGIQFFYKDEFYVLKIAKAVIQHLLDKN